MSEPLERWIDRQYRHSALQMMGSVSAVELEMRRPAFDQRVRPVRGSIIASPVPGAYDPDPDYFFHWYRDSAVVVDALRMLLEGDRVELDPRAAVADFIDFSVKLADLDGRTAALPPASHVHPDYRRFLRPPEELAAVHDAAVALDTRVNPDGTLDILRWARPQFDGPALRALALLRWRHSGQLPAGPAAGLETLLRADLALVLERADRPCFDLWEEEEALHYYTLRIAAAALSEGAAWLDRHSPAEAQACRETSAMLLRRLDDFWDPLRGYYRSRIPGPTTDERKLLDVAVLLATLHSGAPSGAHSAADPRVHATLGALERLFEARYAINQGRPPERAPALGRYDGDVYFSGGAYYFATLGAAELCYRAALAPGAPHGTWMEHGDAYLRTVRVYTPRSGDLAEQFDQRSGAPASARHLAWSYASFISAITARDAAGDLLRCK
ncbi:MAG TPA: glycoside hydrolase family 15 protein [Steroidobacteraceae bacterium]|nr:glycoside hydrolase family 15 protein [Steroidobacteraceae bacterium]